MKHYPQEMRAWSKEHRRNGEIVAASDLECAADQMDRLIDERDTLKVALQNLVTRYEEVAQDDSIGRSLDDHDLMVAKNALAPPQPHECTEVK